MNGFPQRPWFPFCSRQTTLLLPPLILVLAARLDKDGPQSFWYLAMSLIGAPLSYLGAQFLGWPGAMTLSLPFPKVVRITDRLCVTSLFPIYFKLVNQTVFGAAVEQIKLSSITYLPTYLPIYPPSNVQAKPYNEKLTSFSFPIRTKTSSKRCSS